MLVPIMPAGFTKTVGLEMAQKGNITCNAICPGYVLTDLIRNQLEDTAKARGISKVCHEALYGRSSPYGSLTLVYTRVTAEKACAVLQLGIRCSATQPCQTCNGRLLQCLISLASLPQADEQHRFLQCERISLPARCML